MSSSNYLDRAEGALLGLAIADALGTTLEFSARDSYAPLTDIVGGGPFALPAGAWTDDTSMALCLAASLQQHKQLDPHDCMSRFVNWWRYGYLSATGECFDIGGVTRDALARYEASGNPFAGPIEANTAGNGSLMRLVPVVIAARADRQRALRDAAAQSRLTHGAAEAVEACVYFAALLFEALHGAGPEAVLWPRLLPEDLPERLRRCASTDWRLVGRDEISSSGYVMHTLEAAMWAVSQSTCFREAVIHAVNLGGDADTIGAVTGQLAGALWGRSNIPSTWQHKVLWGDSIIATARSLALD